MRAFHAPGGAGEILARTSFLEPLVHGRRVLELGALAATGGSSARALARLGATSVLAADHDPDAVSHARAAGSHPAVRYELLSPGALPEGPFDLVLVHDGAPLAAAPEEALRLRGLLAPGGRLAAALPVVGAPSLGALSDDAPPAAAPAYESFVGSLEAVFPVVEIATQSAALGWVLAAAADLDPELAVDGAHGEPPEAAAYLAVCGDGPSGLAGMLLVTLPAAEALRAAAARARVDLSAIEADLATARAEALGHAGLAEAAERGADEADLARARARDEVREAAESTRAAEAAAEALRGRVTALEAELAAARAAEAERAGGRDVARAEALARAREARAWADAQGKLEQRISELEALAASQARELEITHDEAARAIAEASVARARGDEARYEAEAALRRAAGAEAELRRLGQDLAAGQGELARLRAALAEARGRAAGGAEG